MGGFVEIAWNAKFLIENCFELSNGWESIKNILFGLIY